MEKTEKQPAIYIVFSPQGITAPVKQHETHKQALGVAHRMAKLNPGKDFYVMKQASKACRAEAEQEIAA